MNLPGPLKKLDERLMDFEIYGKMKERKAPLLGLVVAAGEIILSAEAYSRGDTRNGTDWANDAIINIGASLISYNANGDFINYANIFTNLVGGGIMGGAYSVYPIRIYLAAPAASGAQIITDVVELARNRGRKKK